MFSTKKHARREGIRRHRPDAAAINWTEVRDSGVPTSIGIAAAFFVLASLILMLRQDVMPYRPEQWVSHDIVSRVGFSYTDKDLLARKQRQAADDTPRIYTSNGDVWSSVEKELLQVPDRLPQEASAELPKDLRGVFDSGAVTSLRRFLTVDGRDAWESHVKGFVDAIRAYRIPGNGQKWPIYILPEVERRADIHVGHPIQIQGAVLDPELTFPDHTDPRSPAEQRKSEQLHQIITSLVKAQFRLSLQPAIVDFTLSHISPTHHLDLALSSEATNRAIGAVSPTAGEVWYSALTPLVHKSTADQKLSTEEWQLLKAENQKYISSLHGYLWKSRAGLVGICLAVTIMLTVYLARFQPKLIRNHARASAIAALLLSMLLLNQITGIGSAPLYLFGLAPTILVAMILSIAYDQRLAIGVAGLQAILATVALDQSVAFLCILLVGVIVSSLLLDDIRSRSKLIEVGGMTAVAIAAATAAASLLDYDPWQFTVQNCLYACAAGLGVGFVVLGILPFVEKAFRITTSMTLLELADASQPLLRRLAAEAAGTYNHSLQVATISEAAAEMIHANSLLCRVGSYYHDVGKIHKAEYFVENQIGRENRHLNLNPSVSLMIIIGHVKDGVELAKEYNLPTALQSFIQQHHGTTLVEYFYHQARTQSQQRPTEPEVSEYQYRYPGPKPRSREVAIVMIADAVESACRAMTEPNAGRMESLVHEIAMKRLLDGQFDECDLTMRDLETIERSMVKTLLGIYHGRIAYPTLAPPGLPLHPVRTA